MYNDVEGEGGRREESMIHLEETSLPRLADTKHPKHFLLAKRKNDGKVDALTRLFIIYDRRFNAVSHHMPSSSPLVYPSLSLPVSQPLSLPHSSRRERR